ncbi:TraI/MobA(P) family conjugative relaxase [Microbulbifer aggregans]|uniref:TraI/MobA(P) family conjugative relaxase n=1 Tax=Microbulbifer aggregans TaxID=1769779 RepID=UPI001CFC5162|nr:TraI/MobA(P) family conjugative relaxase [Microbulbifer aggregans]
MIAKRSPRRSDSKSSFSTLAKYITDQKHGGEKVGFTKVTNCQTEKFSLAVAEIEATQALNTRAKNDKTYHLIVSFREGDSPTPEQLTDIEHEICSAIGLSEHQRMSALHTDTDNPHLHIAINKIHPETLRMVEPYYDQYRLGEACERLEKKHDLQVDNHAHDKKRAQRKSTPELDEMREGGQKPLVDWLTERKPSIEKIESWKNLHKAFSELGCQVKLRGNGLSILDIKSGIAVKASAVDRQLSKAQLEKRLGKFEPGMDVPGKAQGQYKSTDGHIEKSAARAELWEKFTHERNSSQAERKKAYKAIGDRKAKELRRIKLEYEEKRAAIKRGDLARLRNSKIAAYSTLKAARVAATEKVNEAASQQRASIREQYALPDWREWLQSQAEQGNIEALKALRTAKPRKLPDAVNQLAGEKDQAGLFDRYKHEVHRNGAVTYRLKSGVIVDHGRHISLGNQTSPELIEASLRMAMHKFGKNVQIKGSDEFMAMVEPIAKKVGLNRERIARKSTPLDQILQDKNSQSRGKSNIMDLQKWQGKAGTYMFLGLEKHGDKQYLIMQGAKQKFVKEVSAADAELLKGMQAGSSLQIDGAGKLQDKSRSKGR